MPVDFPAAAERLEPQRFRFEATLGADEDRVEQTTSKTLPLLVLRDLGIEGTEERLAAGIARLLSMQTPSGGFSYWPGGSKPHTAGSVYATHALALAAREGVPVPRPTLERALAFVEGVLDSPRWGKAEAPRGRSRTHALYVLSLAGRGHESWLESLAPDPFLALAAIEMGKPERAREILRAARARAPAFEVDDFHSPGRAAAATVTAAGGARILLDGREVAVAALERTVRLDLPGLRAGRRLRIEGDRPLHYAVTVRGERESGKEPIDQGFWLRRTYARPGEAALPATESCAGEVVTIRLTVFVRGRRRYVCLEDPLPAGLEPIERSFRAGGADTSGSSGFDHTEQRDDRFFASAQALEPGVHELSYLTRATAAGIFTAPAPLAEEMYDPEVCGRGERAVIVVRPR